MSAIVMEQEQIYTVREVAELLRVDRRTIFTMIAKGELEAFKVRSEWRITQSAIDAVMKRRKDS